MHPQSIWFLQYMWDVMLYAWGSSDSVHYYIGENQRSILIKHICVKSNWQMKVKGCCASKCTLECAPIFMEIFYHIGTFVSFLKWYYWNTGIMTTVTIQWWQKTQLSVWWSLLEILVITHGTLWNTFSCYKWHHGISRGSCICTQALSKYFTEYGLKSIFFEKKMTSGWKWYHWNTSNFLKVFFIKALSN